MSGDEEENDSMMGDENDAFKILIATDIHLGFMEKHPIRGIYYTYIRKTM